MAECNEIVRCFLCRKKNSRSKGYKQIDETMCPASKKNLRSILDYLSNLSKIELHIPRNEWICYVCYFQITEYDAYLLRTLKKQRDLLRLVENALVSVDSDFEEFEAEMQGMQNDHYLEELDVGDHEINMIMEEAIGRKRKHAESTRQSQKHGDNNEEYHCSLCAMSFRSKTSFQKHMTQSHKKFSCELCPYSHRNEDYVILHMNLHEGRSENQCRFCDKEFTTKISAIRHMEVHLDHNKYQCDKCGLCFSQATVLYNHKLQHEAEEKPLRCDICNQLFKTKRTYRHHLITHKPDRPRHACDICGRVFTEKYTLKVHKRTHHEDSLELVQEDKKHNILQVVEDVPQPVALVHISQQPTTTHAGTDKLYCIICDQSFPTREQVNRHMEKDHDVILKSLPFDENYSQCEVANEGKKPCHICDEVFFTQNNLDYHLETTHGVSFK